MFSCSRSYRFGKSYVRNIRSAQQKIINCVEFCTYTYSILACYTQRTNAANLFSSFNQFRMNSGWDGTCKGCGCFSCSHIISPYCHSFRLAAFAIGNHAFYFTFSFCLDFRCLIRNLFFLTIGSAKKTASTFTHRPSSPQKLSPFQRKMRCY